MSDASGNGDRFEVSWLAPVLASRPVKELLASDVGYADKFFSLETKNIRRLYYQSGNPKLAYLCGQGFSQLGLELQLKGCLGLGALEVSLGELLIATGSSEEALNLAAVHLNLGLAQIEGSPRTELVARLLGQWYMMMAVVYKASRRVEDYASVLKDGIEDRWLLEHADPGDIVPISRQRVMMRQDINEHIALLDSATRYKSTRPIEYYRTVKRVIEFLTNRGLVASASRLERELLLAYAQSGDKTTISKVSMGRDMAQLAGLKGEKDYAKKLVSATLSTAQSAELFGQVRQLRVLSAAIDQGDVLGALEQFQVLRICQGQCGFMQVVLSTQPVRSSTPSADGPVGSLRAVAGMVEHGNIRSTPTESARERSCLQNKLPAFDKAAIPGNNYRYQSGT
jgi:hypothetical protein